MPLALMMVAALGVIGMLLSGINTRLHTVTIAQRTAIQEEALLSLAKDIEWFSFFNFRYPNTLTELSNQDGGEPISALIDDRIGYTTASLSQSGLSYQRVLVWHKKNDSALVDSAVLENNQFGGVTTFFEKDDYKPPSTVFWYQEDSRNVLGYLRNQLLSGLDETAQRLVYANDNLPREAATGTMTNGDAIMMSAAVGYTGTSAACSGVFNFDGAPLTCSDLFAVDGSLIVYQRVSDDSALISIETNSILDESGDNTILFTELVVR